MVSICRYCLGDFVGLSLKVDYIVTVLVVVLYFPLVRLRNPWLRLEDPGLNQICHLQTQCPSKLLNLFEPYFYNL